MSSIVLVSAVLASLAVGVLVAYCVCVAMFGMLRMHSEQVRETRLATARAQTAQTQA